MGLWLSLTSSYPEARFIISVVKNDRKDNNLSEQNLEI